MKPISIFYFINPRLDITLNEGLGALTTVRTGIHRRISSDNTQWLQDRTGVPPRPRASSTRGHIADCLEPHLSSVDSRSNSKKQLSLLSSSRERSGGNGVKRV